MFVGSDDGHVYELDQDSGAIIRKFFVGTEVSPEPVIWNHRLFAGEGIHTTHHARIYSYDLKTGGLVGTFQTKGHIERMPAIFESNGHALMFIPAGKDGLYAVDPETLQEVWHRTDLGHVDNEVRVDEGRVFIASGIEKGTTDRIHRAHALRFPDGATVWKEELPASSWHPPLITETDVCFTTGEIYVDSKYGQFSCYDKRTGLSRFSYNSDAPLHSVPLKVGSLVIVGDLSGQVCAIHWPKGWKSWCSQTYQKNHASVSYDEKGYFVYPSKTDGVLVLDPRTGTRLIEWNPSDAEGKLGEVYGRITTTAGAWFIADMSGNVRRVRPVYESTRQLHAVVR